MLLAAAHAAARAAGRARRMTGRMMRPRVASRKSARLRRALLRVRELRPGLGAALIGAAVTLREPRFLQPANLEQVALSATLVCIVALGQALVIIARQIDLSVGAIVAMSAFVAADWLEDHPDGSHRRSCS